MLEYEKFQVILTAGREFIFCFKSIVYALQVHYFACKFWKQTSKITTLYCLRLQLKTKTDCLSSVLINFIL